MSIKDKPSYQKALIELSTWDNPAEGLVFSADSDSTGTKVQKLIKQNNFIISLLTELSDKVEKLEFKLNTSEPSSSTDINDLVSKLSNLSLSSENRVPARKEAPFYVLKDPRKIWKEESEKIHGSKN